jgi:hypothetical protein
VKGVGCTVSTPAPRRFRHPPTPQSTQKGDGQTRKPERHHIGCGRFLYRPRATLITPRAILPCERLKNSKTRTSFRLVSISLNAARMQRKTEISTKNVFTWSDNCINNLEHQKSSEDVQVPEKNLKDFETRQKSEEA